MLHLDGEASTSSERRREPGGTSRTPKYVAKTEHPELLRSLRVPAAAATVG
jgi:hypothetical protein